MADRVDFIDKLIQYNEDNEGPRPRQRVLRDRLHPLDIYDDVDIYARLRFRKDGIMKITDMMLAEDIQHNSDLNGALPPSIQVCVALRYFATGSFQNIIGDTIQIHKSTVCRTVRRAAVALCTRINDFVYMPVENQNLNYTRQKFHAVAGFPDVIGCIDGTHVKISPPSVDENAYINRKGFHSLNVQVE